MTDTADLLLRSVLDAPEDDAPRLVYADWLEEQGDVDRAEFIRLQLELAKPWHATVPDAASKPLRDMRRRERELLSHHWWKWYGFNPGCVVHCLNITGDNQGDGLAVEFHRGFVAEVRCDLRMWCGGKCPRCGGLGKVAVFGDCKTCHGTGRTPGVGPAVAACQPVERCVLVDREPYPMDGERARHFWLNRDFPGDLWDLIHTDDEQPGVWKRYPSKAEAVDALALAAARWARDQAQGGG